MQQGERQRGCISLDLIGASIAATAGILLCVRALGRFDNSWDGTHYHLVLAALRAHILTFNDFEPIPNVVAFYHSYPRLLDTVRGYVWRFTGSILILQTFNLIAIAALVTFWRWRFGLSIRWTLVAILSVPLIQISATTLYVDTFANCFFAIAISALGVAFIDRRPLVRSEFIVALAALAVSANVKPQFVVLATIALTILCIYQLLCLMRQDSRADLRFFLGLAAIAWLLVPAMGIRNFLLYRNPFYPITISMFGHSLPGLFTPTDAWKGPDYLSHMPQVVRWLASVFEYRAFEGSDIPYTIDQHNLIPVGVMPALDLRPPSFRMGGYFVPLVLGLFTWLVIFTRSYAPRDRIRWFVPLLLASFIAFIPSSNELRYYSFWILDLIFLCFVAAHRSQENSMAFRASLIVAFLSVGMVTGWSYFDPRPYSVQDHIHKYGIDRTVTGRDICFENRNRDPILFTWIFHNAGHYRVTDLPPGEHCPPA